MVTVCNVQCVGTWCLYSQVGVGELQLAIIVELCQGGYCAFMGTDGHLQGFWLLMAVCCSWDIVGGWKLARDVSRYVVGGVANDPHPLPHRLICVIYFD